MNKLGSFHQAEIKTINPQEFVKMMEDWSEQLRPIMEHQKQKEQNHLENRRHTFAKYVNDNFGNCKKYSDKDKFKYE